MKLVKTRLVFLVVIFLTMSMSACTAKDEKEKGTEPPKPVWEQKIKTTAASQKSQSEKADEVSLMASSYQPKGEEVEKFSKDIIEEFTKGQYLSDIQNHEYMLTNIFKSQVVENYYDDEEKKPIDKFAYDFFQNINYTYRGSMKPESNEIKANEEQMRKLAAEME